MVSLAEQYLLMVLSAVLKAIFHRSNYTVKFIFFTVLTELPGIDYDSYWILCYVRSLFMSRKPTHVLLRRC